MLAIWAAAKAVGIDESPRLYYVMGPLFFLVLLVPFTLNGFAVREAFFVSFLGGVGVDAGRGLRGRLPLLPRHGRDGAPGRRDPALGRRARRRPRRGPSMADAAVASPPSSSPTTRMPWIEQCLESVRGLETVVVDHGSTDGTRRARPRALPRGARSSSRRTSGSRPAGTAAWRRSAASTGLILNADAWLTDGSTGAAARFADAHPRAAIVGPRLLNPGRLAAALGPRASRRSGGWRPSTSSCASSRPARGC